MSNDEVDDEDMSKKFVENIGDEEGDLGRLAESFMPSRSSPEGIDAAVVIDDVADAFEADDAFETLGQ